jgi:ferredoxin
MIFGPSAQFATNHGFVHLLSKEEARQRIDEAEKAGLVHNYANSHDRYIDLMCNCCGCHCLILRGAKRAPVPSQAVIANWVIIIENDACVGCGACIDANRCIGCGICRYVCPTDAMKLVAREKAPLKS